jgi:aminomethyltransferase
MTGPSAGHLKKTPLFALHRELGAKMVPFAGYEMPVRFAGGIIAEHRHTRNQASLFDVSHMGQAILRGDDPARALERLVPADIKGLAAGKMRYTQFTNPAGGILDDLMVTNRGDHLFLVVNAARKEADFAHLEHGLGNFCSLEILADRALIAVQGPAAAEILTRHAAGIGRLRFMEMGDFELAGQSVMISRSGYSGEDGFEISATAQAAGPIAALVLAESKVAPAGLGARDSLRLEAGLCLYGNDIDETTTPVEAGLGFSIAKRRRQEGGFPGDGVIRAQFRDGVSRRLTGIRPDGPAPARAGTPITDTGGRPIGKITSGGFAPSIDGPAAMGYVDIDHAAAGTEVQLTLRRRQVAARVEKLPFVAHRYFRG